MAIMDRFGNIDASKSPLEGDLEDVVNASKKTLIGKSEVTVLCFLK